MITDEVLYNRYHSGDQNAADELVKRHADALTIYLYGCIRDFHEAEDLMIEAFSLMFSKRRPVDYAGSFRAYLYRIGRNLVLRHQKKSLKSMLLSDQINFEPVEERTGEHILVLKERNRSLYLAMEQLKPEYREALYLVYFEEMKYAEAASVMGKTVSQLNNLVSRGKQRMKSILAREGFVYEER